MCIVSYPARMVQHLAEAEQYVLVGLPENPTRTNAEIAGQQH